MKKLHFQNIRSRCLDAIFISICVFLALGAIKAVAEGGSTKLELEPQRAVIEAINSTIISSELSGRIHEMKFREGDAFKKGNVLIRMDCGQYSAERDRVGARLTSARRQLENNRRLSELRSIGKLDVDLSRLSVNENEAEYRIASSNVSRCNIKAPYDGRVVERKASVGQSVEAQAELLSIVGMTLEARIIVPADWLVWLKPGDKTNLAVEEAQQIVAAKLTRIGASVDPVSHTIPIWAELEVTPDLRPGMTASAIFTPSLEAAQMQ